MFSITTIAPIRIGPKCASSAVQLSGGQGRSGRVVRTPGTGFSKATSASPTAAFDEAASAGCAWTATAEASSFSTVTSFSTVDSGSPSSGNGTVNYSYTANPGAASRTGTITVAGTNFNQNFTITQAGVGQPPPAVTVFAPGQGATGISLTAPVTWGAANGATSYDVFFGTSTTPPFVTNTTGTSYAPGTLRPGTIYYWSVTAKNAAGSTPSALWFYTTAPAWTR